MKIGDVVTLNEINKWKNKKYSEIFIPNRLSMENGKAWWNRTKKNVLNNTKFKVIQMPGREITKSDRDDHIGCDGD